MSALSTVLDVLAAALLLSGVALTLLAGVGMLRLPDVLTRMHAQTKPAVLGLLLILAGTAAATRHAGLAGTLLVVAAFQVLTAPVGAHMIGRAAHRSGAPATREDGTPWLVRDDLARPGPRSSSRSQREDRPGSP